MHGGLAALTIASKPNLALARVTAASFSAHNPGVPFYVVLADEVQGAFDAAREPFQLLPLSGLGVPGWQRFRFHYNEMELCYAATPFAVRALLDLGFDAVVFLKMETLVTASLEPLFDALRRHPLVLTPHHLVPSSRPGALRTELDTLRAGVFNGGLIGAGTGAREFIEWWGRRTWRHCFRAVERGLHFEQRWLDLAPSLLPGTHVLRDPGVNVGHWNLPERQVRAAGAGFTANASPLRVFRFSGYQFARSDRITCYHPDKVSDAGHAAALFERYHALLEQSGYRVTQCWPYAWGSYDDGSPVPDAHRRAYWQLGDDVDRFGDPLETRRLPAFRSWVRWRRWI